MGKSLQTMEEARASVPQETADRLGRIWDKAFTYEVWKGNQNASFYVNKPSEKLVLKVIEVLNLDENTRINKQSIRLNGIRHIDTRHGIRGEVIQGQIPMTKTMFQLIPDALDNFTIIEPGIESRGSLSVKITKEYSDGTMVIADAVVGNEQLEIRSIWIDKPNIDKGRLFIRNSDLSPNYHSRANVIPDDTSKPEERTFTDTNNIQIFSQELA